MQGGLENTAGRRHQCPMWHHKGPKFRAVWFSQDGVVVRAVGEKDGVFSHFKSLLAEHTRLLYCYHWGKIIKLGEKICSIQTFCDFIDSTMTITEGNSNWNFKQHHQISQTLGWNEAIRVFSQEEEKTKPRQDISIHALPPPACNSHEIWSGVCLQGTGTNHKAGGIRSLWQQAKSSMFPRPVSLPYLLLHVQQGLPVRLQHGVQAGAEGPQVTAIEPRLIGVVLLVDDNTVEEQLGFRTCTARHAETKSASCI